MDMFLYMDKDTYMHRLDPRTKTFMMLGSFAIIAMFYTLTPLMVISALVILYGASGKTLPNLKRIRVVLMMIGLFSLVIWSFAKPGATPVLGPISWEGIIYGVAMAIKIDTMIIAGMIFLSSTKMEEIPVGWVRLKIPYRVAFAFSTALRLVPTIVGTSYIITQAQESRGLDLQSGNLLVRAKKYIPLLIPVFVSVIRGTNVFAMALESKGFGYSDKRSNYLETGYNKADIILLTVLVLLLALSIYLKITTKL